MNFQSNELQTPALVYDLDTICARLHMLRKLSADSPLKILYSIKSASFSPLLQAMCTNLDGFATSSVFESILAREVLAERGTVHLSTVALMPESIDETVSVCDFINFNSLSQWQRLGESVRDRVQCGIRINPMTHYVNDARYDPCRSSSKLGVPLDSLCQALTDAPGLLAGLGGLQFHNNCESRDQGQLLETCRLLLDRCPDLMHRIDWINIGGGYLFDENDTMQGLAEAVRLLAGAGIEQVFFEPGKAIVGNTGYLVASVVDLFRSGDRNIAVLDTSINHLPEVFEYQYQPEIMQHSAAGMHEYRLSGMTCLSGDLFGDYRLDQPLQLDDRIVFRNVGAYMFVKASMFNGMNLPSVYLFGKDTGMSLVRQHGYEDYASRLK